MTRSTFFPSYFAGASFASPTPSPVRLAASLRRLAYVGFPLVALACGDKTRGTARGSSAGGTVVIALPSDVETLLPPFAIADQSKLANDLLFDHLADIGDSLKTASDRGFLPRLASTWEWSADSLAIRFHLDPRARWHDGVPVRASDVRFTFRLYTNPAAAVENASVLGPIDSVSVADSLTAVFWFKHRYPEQFFDATYQMLICPEHLLAATPVSDLRTSAFAHHPVGDGLFRFVAWTPGSTLELVADTGNYRGRPRLDRVILMFAPGYTAAFTKFMTGDADFYQHVRWENLSDLRKQPQLVAIPYDNPAYGFLWFNLRSKSTRPHPLFGDRALRRALAMSLDRERMVRNVFDTLAVVARGPFARSSPVADTTVPQLPYDTVRANRVLDSLGWRRGADGIRHRAGRALAFTVLVPTSSKDRQQLALLVQDQLGRVGVRVTVDPIELGLEITRLRSHDFDAALHLWQTDPSISDLHQMWAKSSEQDGVNYGSYENAAFDAVVDSAMLARDSTRVRQYFHRAYSIITDDAPGVWLYQPRRVAGAHRRIHTAYLRPDAWWAHLGEWYIPPDQQIARDSIGLADAR